jgi:hypothetical protein
MPLNTIAAAAGILLLIQISFADAQGLSRYGIKVGAIHSEQTWDYDSPVYSQFNKWEFGATCALGIELSLGFTPRLLGEISYNTNFTHSFTNENVTVGNQSFSFLLGVCLF